MPNQLKVDVQESINHLLKAGRTQRWISRELGVHRQTVKRYAEELFDSKCTIPLTGSKCTIVPTGKSGPVSQCEVHLERIQSKVEVGLSAQRIYQDLQAEVSFAGGYDSVRRFVQKLKAKDPSVVWRLESEPGEEVQIDYGEMYLLESESGRLKKAYFLRMVLSCTRKGYTEASYRPNSESFIRCLENAFRHFGGVARRACIDNLKAVVEKADWYEPRVHPKLLSFARHYGFTFMPARPRTPTDKGKVENSVKYVKNNALKGRRFKSLAELNTHLAHWETHVADQRIHGTTRKQVQRHFSEVEKPQLLSLPVSLFECFEEGRRKVHRDGYVEVQRAYYHVPREYVRSQVWVRWDSRRVRIFNLRMDKIAIHSRLEPGRFSQTLGVAGVRHSVTESLRYYRSRIETLGHHCLAWADVLIQRNPDQALRQIQGLVGLGKRTSHRQLDQACHTALQNAQYSLRQLKAQLSRPQHQQTLELLEEHPLIRSPSSYETLLPTKHLFQKPL